MTSPDFDARAAMCRRFAKVEPGNRCVWLAEAERWSVLARTRLKPPVGDNHRNESRSSEGCDIDPLRLLSSFYFGVNRPN
jgi:hypothetical protein